MQVLYRFGPTSGEFSTLALPGCDTVCPLDQFHRLYQDTMLTQEEWEAACAST